MSSQQQQPSEGWTSGWRKSPPEPQTRAPNLDATNIRVADDDKGARNLASQFLGVLATHKEPPSGHKSSANNTTQTSKNNDDSNQSNQELEHNNNEKPNSDSTLTSTTSSNCNSHSNLSQSANPNPNPNSTSKTSRRQEMVVSKLRRQQRYDCDDCDDCDDDDNNHDKQDHDGQQHHNHDHDHHHHHASHHHQEAQHEPGKDAGDIHHHHHLSHHHQAEHQNHGQDQGDVIAMTRNRDYLYDGHNDGGDYDDDSDSDDDVELGLDSDEPEHELESLGRRLAPLVEPLFAGDDRGGPTPTNDLVRSLMQRDQCALSACSRGVAGRRATVAVTGTRNAEAGPEGAGQGDAAGPSETCESGRESTLATPTPTSFAPKHLNSATMMSSRNATNALPVAPGTRKRPKGGKRHSIISLLAGVGFQSHQSAREGPGEGAKHSTTTHLVSRLTRPLAPLFVPMAGHSDHFHFHRKRSSLAGNSDCCHSDYGHSVNNQLAAASGEHYDPLIPENGFKVVVMGTSGSGKTSIIQRFLYDSFNLRHQPTIEDNYFVEFPYMKNMINISITDTSGTYSFPAMKRLSINSGDAFILVYSVDDANSLEELRQLRQQILDEREQAYSEAMSSSTSSVATSGCGSTSGHCEPSLATSGGSGHLAPASPTCHQPAEAAYLSTAPTNTHSLEHNHLHHQHAPLSASPSRHWSLASLFGSGQSAHQQQQHLQLTHHHHHNHPVGGSTSSNASSLCSSFSSSVSICPSSADSSRRSSVSAAEAALKTRRTRHPPIVIVANKHDLPSDKHIVNSDEVEALVVIEWDDGFVRASAALNWNIDLIFQQVLKQARQPPTLTEAIVSKRRKSLPPKLPNNIVGSSHTNH